MSRDKITDENNDVRSLNMLGKKYLYYLNSEKEKLALTGFFSTKCVSPQPQQTNVSHVL